MELVPLTDNVLACINGTQSLDLSDCVGNLKNGFARVLTVKSRSNMDNLV